MQSSIFKKFNENENNYLYWNRYQIDSFSQENVPATYTKMSIAQIVGHILTILSTTTTKNDLEEISKSLKKINARLEVNYLSSFLNFFQGVGFKDSLTLVTETLTKVTLAVDIKRKIEAKQYHELIEYFKIHPEELIKNLELIKTHLDLETDGLLPLLLDKLSTKDLKSVLSSPVSEEAIKKLSKSQILRLSACANAYNLPLYAHNFRKILQQPKNCHVIQKIREFDELTDEEKYAALALYIEHYKYSLCHIGLKREEFLRVAPYLRYVNLNNFEDESFGNQLLQKCSNLNVLYVNNDKILEGIAALPLCEKFDCSGCKGLKALPALPLCKELKCENCHNLEVLPAIPFCEKLDCNLCNSLYALPDLPFCETLLCNGCKSLNSLTALPLCKVLHCDKCIYLSTLPALPLCKELDCCNCFYLEELPSLPLCERLSCYRCIKLQALPALPLCKKLNCVNNTDILTLPALPLCEVLGCHGCTNLTTLPLSLGQNPGLTTIDIDNTRIDPSVRDAILHQCRMMRDALTPTILHARLEKWKAIAKSSAEIDVSTLSDEQKKTLNEWLLRLERTKDFTRSQSLLANTVCNILADLLKNKEFQELFFPQAEANNECCQDRAAMSLNEIFTSWKIICTTEPLPLNVMTGIAKTLRLRKELQKLIKGDERESVEIFLFYESTLSERLQLTTAIQNMTYNTIGKRHWIDHEKLVKDVEDNFIEELIELPVFQKMVKHLWQGIDAEFSDKLEELGDCPEGHPNDTQVLDYQHKQGQIMRDWKKARMLLAKQRIG